MDLLEAVATGGHRHPWELARRDSMLRLVARLRPLGDVADVGAGDRFFASSLRSLIQGHVYAVDVHYPESGFVDGIHTARDVADLPDGGLDCVVLMDVLEHLEDEAVVLGALRPKLRAGGTVLVTVPAFQHLLSAHDEYLKHFRRYRRRTLRPVLERHGLHVEECFYFYSTLFAARWLQVILARVKGPGEQSGVGRWRFGLRHPLTMLVRGALDLDYRACRALARRGFTVPGLSLCCVCKNVSA